MKGHLPENELFVSPQTFPQKLGRVSKARKQRPNQSGFVRALDCETSYLGPFNFSL